MMSLTHYFTIFIVINLHRHRKFPWGVGGGRFQVRSFDVNFLYIFYLSKGEKGICTSVPKKIIPPSGPKFGANFYIFYFSKGGRGSVPVFLRKSYPPQVQSLAPIFIYFIFEKGEGDLYQCS